MFHDHGTENVRLSENSHVKSLSLFPFEKYVTAKEI